MSITRLASLISLLFLAFLLPQSGYSLSPAVCDIQCGPNLKLDPQSCSCKPVIGASSGVVSSSGSNPKCSSAIKCAAGYTSNPITCSCVKTDGSSGATSGPGTDQCSAAIKCAPGYTKNPSTCQCTKADTNGGSTGGGVASSGMGSSSGPQCSVMCPSGYKQNPNSCTCTKVNPTTSGGTGTSSGVTPPTCMLAGCPSGQKLNTQKCVCEKANPTNPSCAPRACPAGQVWMDDRCTCDTPNCPSGQVRIYNKKGEQCVSAAYIQQQQMQLEKIMREQGIQAYMLAQCELSNSERSYKACLSRIPQAPQPNNPELPQEPEKCAVQSYCSGLASSSYIYDAANCACKSSKPCSQYGCDPGYESVTSSTKYGNGTITSCSCMKKTSGSACKEQAIAACHAEGGAMSENCQCKFFTGSSSSGTASSTGATPPNGPFCPTSMCPAGQTRDPKTCQCVTACSPLALDMCTKQGGVFNRANCTCKKPMGTTSGGGGECTKTCESGLTLNPSQCACECKKKPEECNSNHYDAIGQYIGKKLDSKTCTCQCPPANFISCQLANGEPGVSDGNCGCLAIRSSSNGGGSSSGSTPSSSSGGNDPGGEMCGKCTMVPGLNTKCCTFKENFVDRYFIYPDYMDCPKTLSQAVGADCSQVGTNF